MCSIHYYIQCTEHRVFRKTRKLEEYLEALTVLDPGISHNRGKLRYTLYSIHIQLTGCLEKLGTVKNTR